METRSDDAQLGSFLNLLFAADSAVLAFFLFTRPGNMLPAKLPFTLGPVLPLKHQAAALAVCAAVALILRALTLFPGRHERLRASERWIAVVVLAVSLVAMGTGGVAIAGDPSLLPGG